MTASTISQNHYNHHENKKANHQKMMSTAFPLSTVPVNKPLSSSIMAHPVVERKIEIQGSYWPRLLLRGNSWTCNKKDFKKVRKARRKNKKHSSSPSPQKLPASGTSSTSLLEILQDVPALLSEDHPAVRSPVTGKPIVSAKNKGSILVPTKPVRKHLERRSQSDSSYTLD